MKEKIEKKFQEIKTSYEELQKEMETFQVKPNNKSLVKRIRLNSLDIHKKTKEIRQLCSDFVKEI